MKAKIIIPAVALALGVGILWTSTQAKAFGSGSDGTLVQKLAEKLGINEDQVQAAFDEIREEHHQEMSANFEDRLNQAIADNKITEDQKQMIMEKHEQHREKMEAWRDLEPEERRGKMQELHEQMQAWADENDIPLNLFFGGMGKFGAGPGMHGGMGRGMGPRFT